MTSLLDHLRGAADALRASMHAVECETFSSEQSTAIVVAASELTNVVSAIEATCARRAADTNAGAASGASSSLEFLAQQTGTSTEAMRRKVAVARQMEHLPEASQAFREGGLSPQQAEHVARAGAAAPQHEAELLDTARNASVQELKEHCERVEVNARPIEEQERRKRRAQQRRRVRVWKDPNDDGSFAGHFGGPIADLARINAVLDPMTSADFRAARKKGRHEGQDQYRYDAFLDLLISTPPSVTDSGGSNVPVPVEQPLFLDPFTADVPVVDASAADELARVVAKRPSRKNIRSQTLVMVDYAALMRGYAIGDERCSVQGVGQIPVHDVWDVFDDAIVRILGMEGTEVTRQASTDGRKITAETMAAAVARDTECANPLCHNTLGLQLDHRRPEADHGPPVLSNLAMLCPTCHRKKTYEGSCLVGPRDAWIFVRRREKGDGGWGYPLDHDEDPNDYLPSRRAHDRA